jgi:IS5 family transposase
MPQLTFAAAGFEPYRKTTRREVFLAEMNHVVPWAELCALIEPGSPQPTGAGRRPVGVDRMLRISFLQQWFHLSDPAVEEALYDSTAMRTFVGIDLGREPVPDETAVCRFRHLLEPHRLGATLFEAVTRHLAARGVRVATDTIVDATIIYQCAEFDEECGPGTGSRDAPDGQGPAVVLRDEGASRRR